MTERKGWSDRFRKTTDKLGPPTPTESWYGDTLRELRQLAAPPDIIYHYTTQEGLIGIVGSRTLYATDVRYLNDEREYRYTLDIAREALRQIPDSDDDHALIAACKTAIDEVGTYQVYVASFSEWPDQLSQWRAYSRASGYSIGFRGQGLEKATRYERGQCLLLKCIYDAETQVTFIGRLLDRTRHAYRRAQAPVGESSLTAYAALFKSQLNVLAACFKDPGFEEENEWRLVLWHHAENRDASRVKFRAGARTLIPYVEIRWGATGMFDLIRRVVVGPTPHMNTAVAAVRAYLASKDVGSVRVAPSERPFRDW